MDSKSKGFTIKCNTCGNEIKLCYDNKGEIQVENNDIQMFAQCDEIWITCEKCNNEIEFYFF